MKRTLLLMLVLLTLILCVACAGPDSEDTAVIGGADGPTDIVVGGPEVEGGDEVTLVLDWTPNINHSGAYAALALGYFAEQGINVDIVQPGDNYALQLVASGQAEFGFSYQEEVTYARMADMPVKSLAAVIQHNTSCFAAPTDKGIKTVADFAGRVYGGWGGEVEQALLDYLVEREGLDQPVEVVNLGSADFFAATAGDIDFSWIFYGVTGVEAELRGVPLDLIWLKDIDPAFDYYTPVIVAEEGWLAENGDLAARFMAALSKGYQYADAHPAETADILSACAPELDAELVAAGQDWLAGRYQDDAPYWGWQDEAVWSDFAAWLIERGLLDAGFNAADAFTNDYLPQE